MKQSDVMLLLANLHKSNTPAEDLFKLREQYGFVFSKLVDIYLHTYYHLEGDMKNIVLHDIVDAMFNIVENHKEEYMCNLCGNVFTEDYFTKDKYKELCDACYLDEKEFE